MDMEITEVLGPALETSRNISEFGILVVIAGFFLVLSAVMMITYFRWFMRIINDMLTTQRKTMEELLDSTVVQNSQLADIAEGLLPETQLRIKAITNMAFDLAVEKVCRIIKRMREENHLDDKETTRKKIRQYLQNIFEDRNSKFDLFTYRGKKLSHYTNPVWIEEVAKVVEDELYNAKGVNNARAFSNVSIVYNKIRGEFHHRTMGE